MTKEQILDFSKQHKQEMNDRFGVTKIGTILEPLT